MLGRIALAGVVALSMGASTAWATGPSIGGIFWHLKHECSHLAQSTQCAVQVTKGSYNTAVTEQSTKLHGRHRRGTQTSLTYQDGDNNIAYTGQFGRNQSSLTTQIGDDNHAFTYQSGKNQASTSTEVGNGQWEATSSIGNGAQTSVSFVTTPAVD